MTLKKLIAEQEFCFNSCSRCKDRMNIVLDYGQHLEKENKNLSRRIIKLEDIIRDLEKQLDVKR